VPNSGKVFIVSSRLPATLVTNGDGSQTLKRSSGGLVAGLDAFHQNHNSVWFGVLGDGADEERLQKLLADQRLRAIDVPPGLYKQYYEGFSNGALWPIFHYLPERAQFELSAWDAYKRVNQIFAEAIAPHLHDGDFVWVHDYQLMLLPALLRKIKPRIGIGFFLHIPFPSAEVFRIIPSNKQLLEGMFGADLVGFHTLEYTRHFANAAAILLGLNLRMDCLDFEYHDRRVRIGAFPLGIDVGRFYNAARAKECEALLAVLHDEYRNVQVILGVDRLDYTKGIPDRLRAFLAFLEQYPEWVVKELS